MDDDTKKKAKEAGAAMCDGLMERMAKKEKGPWPPETAPSPTKQIRVLDAIIALKENIQRQLKLLDNLYYMLLLGWKYAGKDPEKLNKYRSDYYELNRGRYQTQVKLRRYAEELRKQAETDAEKLASG